MYRPYVRQIKTLGQVLLAAIVLFCVWILFSTFRTLNADGTLYIKAANPKAGLIISQANRQALAVGVGSAKIHVKPGLYRISAIENGEQSNTTATVYKKHTTISFLGAVQSVMLPSAQSINFEGTNTLINNGLTVTQVSALEEEFFQFKRSAHTVIIDTNSVEPGPHNPNVDTSFTINFSVAVDSMSYKATISYSDLESVQLSLYSTSDNNLVFNSGSNSGLGVD